MRLLQRLAICLTVILCGADMAQAEKLVILHTNDTHSQIDPAEDGLGGVARRKVVIDSVRAVHPDLLLIDAGDVVQGSLFFNIYKGELEEQLMNALGYDIRILGNHEFDNGLDILASNLRHSHAQLLTTNYQTRGTALEGLFKPYTVVERDGKLIAFMAINLNPKGMISQPNYEGMGYVDAVEAANNMAWFLKNILQADYVVALTHIGYEANEKPDDVELITRSKDIDMVIGGHTHTVLGPGTGSTKPYVIKNAEGRDVLVAQTGSRGKSVGEIVIDLDDLGTLPQSQLISVDSRLDDRIDPAIISIIEPYRREVDAINARPVATTKRELSRSGDEMLNYFSDLLAYRGRQLADNVDFAIFNRGGLRHDLAKGTVTEGDIITLIPFFNTLQVIDIKGDRLAEVFDIMAGTGGNGVSSEVDAVIDPATGKCTRVTINGKPLDPTATYRVATNDYLANGGDYMTPLTDHVLVAKSDRLIFEDVLDYLRGPGKGKPISASDKKRMHR